MNSAVLAKTDITPRALGEKSDYVNRTRDFLYLMNAQGS